MKAIADYRVSSDSQRDNTSLENQKKQVQRYADAKDIKIVAQFQDVASGGSTDRKGLQNALKYIQEYDRDIDVFMVYKYDRAHRNLKETLIFVDELKELNIHYVSVSQDIDTITPHGRLFFQMVCSFAEFEKEVIRERCREGREAKIDKRETPGGRPALGYDSHWRVDSKEVEIVRDLFRNYLNLKSLAKVARYAGRHGYGQTVGLTLSRTSLRDMLRNRAYLGEFTYDGESENHKVFWKEHHEAIIARPLFGKVQKLLDKNCKRKVSS